MRCGVHVTRCRHISKPVGAKPGLVHVAPFGKLRTVHVDLANEEERLARLEAQVAPFSAPSATDSLNEKDDEKGDGRETDERP